MRSPTPVLIHIALTAFVIAMATSGVQAESNDEKKKACADPDMQARVIGNKFCFAIRAYGAQTAGPSPTLVVVLHGDGSSGAPPEYHDAIAESLVASGVVAIGMIRPGYTSKDDRTSDGSSIRSDHYTAENIDAVADAISKLKAHYKAQKTVMIGHSGGAATTGVVIGRHAGLVDRALLISCPCDIARWRSMGFRRPWSSLSPSDFSAKVPATTKVLAITGELDDNTAPILAKDYAAALAAQGVNARFAIIPGASHNVTRVMRESDIYRQAMTNIVAGDF